MNKNFWLSLLVATPSMISPAYAEEKTDIDILFPEIIKTFNQFSSILDKVADQPQLEKQTKNLEAVEKQLLAHIEQAKKLPDLNEGKRYSTAKKFTPVMQRVMIPLTKNLARLGKDKLTSPAYAATLKAVEALNKELTPRVEPKVSPTLEELRIDLEKK